MKKQTGEADIFSFDCGHCTHIGKRRQNQDAVLMPPVPIILGGNGRLFAVADGMGGHPGGGIASQMACDRLSEINERCIQKNKIRKPFDIRRHLLETVFRIDRAIRLRGIRDHRLKDMGTTLSCLVITATHSVVAHVGDSRIYRLRKGRLNRLTVDHTFVQDMILEGEVDPAQASFHPLRHMLTRVVGTGEPLEWVDTRMDGLKKSDRFLLCTDGLYDAMHEKDILDSLTRQSDAADMAFELVAKANENGARDNITAVVVKILSLGGVN